MLIMAKWPKKGKNASNKYALELLQRVSIIKVLKSLEPNVHMSGKGTLYFSFLLLVV
jgi:hypothetical protein